MPNDDMVDAMLAAVSGLDSVSGLSEVGFGDYSDEEVGRIVRRAHNMRRGGHMPPQATSSAHATPPRGVSAPMFQRSARETLRRASGGFAQFSLAAAIGSTDTQSMKVSRVVHVDRLLIVPSAAGIVIDSIKVGDEEQLLTPGVPVELYGTSALTDSLSDNFSPLGSGIDLSITLRNTTAGALTALAGVKGGVER